MPLNFLLYLQLCCKRIGRLCRCLCSFFQMSLALRAITTRGNSRFTRYHFARFPFNGTGKQKEAQSAVEAHTETSNPEKETQPAPTYLPAPLLFSKQIALILTTYFNSSHNCLHTYFISLLKPQFLLSICTILRRCSLTVVRTVPLTR
jgi:hypothetical protein